MKPIIIAGLIFIASVTAGWGAFPKDQNEIKYQDRMGKTSGSLDEDFKDPVEELAKAMACYDQAKALEPLQKAAERGDANAQLILGICYHEGLGVTNDLTKAFELYQQSAEQGDDWAQFNLGLCYYFGRGVAKNITKAVEWWQKGAEQGHSNS